MCLISFNWLDHPIFKLILVANRDEFFDRKTSSLELWPTGFYAGKDLKGGGTWMGVHPKGKFAALTNYRSLTGFKKSPISRGFLVMEFLENEEAPFEYLHRIQNKKDQYDGFNLLVADGNEMGYLSNYIPGPEKVSPGIHGISNSILDTPWQKVIHAREDLSDLINQKEVNESTLMGLLQSKGFAQDELLPDTGVSLELERMLSAQFIRNGNTYGTVNTSGILWKHDGSVVMIERRTIAPMGETRKEFKMVS